MTTERNGRISRRAGLATLVTAIIFTAGMVHSAERTVLGEYITADW